MNQLPLDMSNIATGVTAIAIAVSTALIFMVKSIGPAWRQYQKEYRELQCSYLSPEEHPWTGFHKQWARDTGKLVKLCRKANGMSQAELADSAGLDEDFVSSVERGVAMLQGDALIRMARALGVGLEDITPEKGESAGDFA